jgi:glucans biosynthesis protein C
MTSSREHIHLWDNIRGAWILSVVVAHTVTSFATPQSDYYRDAGAHPIFDFLFVFIRTFRLPLYFVMAGFLAALQFERHGLAATVRNRFKRIVVPMVVGWLLMFPLLQLAIAYNLHVAGTTPFPGVVETLENAVAHADLDFYWFLYYLLLCYVTVLAVRALVCKVASDRRRMELQAGFRALLSWRWAAPCLMLASAPTMIADMNSWHLRKLPGLFDTPTSLVPVVQVVAGYSVFFAFGWLLYQNRDLLQSLERGAIGRVVSGTLMVHVCHLDAGQRSLCRHARQMGRDRDQ